MTSTQRFIQTPNRTAANCFVCCAVFFLFPATAQWSWAQDETDVAATNDAATETDELLEKWLLQLNSDTSVERQQALRALLDIGVAAVPELEARLMTATGVTKQDAKRQLRLLGVLLRMNRSTNMELKNRSQRALTRISTEGNVKLRRHASRAVTQMNQSLEDDTIERLRDMKVQVKLFRSKMARNLPQEYYITIDKNYTGTLEDLNLLALLQKPSEVTLIGPMFTDQHLEKVIAMNSLYGITLRNTQVTDEGLLPLQDVTSMKSISVSESDVTMKSIEPLSKLPRLKQMLLGGTKVTGDEARMLANQYPKMQIRWHAGAFLGVNFKSDDTKCELTLIIENSGASRAGMQVGDVIVEFADKPIVYPFDFSRAIAPIKPGETVNAVVLRDGKRVKMKVTLTKYPDNR